MFGRRKRSRLQDIRIMNELFPAADAVAAADGERDTGAEHLLIAALDLDTGSARRAFERSGVDPDQFRTAVRAQHADAIRAVGMRPISDDLLDQHLPPPAPDAGPHRGSPSGHELFRRVVALVREERSQLYGAYFVLVAAETERGTTARALRHMNVDPAALAAGARAEIDALNAGLDDTGPSHAGPRNVGPRDAGPPNGGPPNAGPPNAGPCDASSRSRRGRAR